MYVGKVSSNTVGNNAADKSIPIMQFYTSSTLLMSCSFSQ